MSDELIQHDRLSALEGAVRDVSFKTGAIESGLEHMMTTLQEGFQSLREGHQTCIAQQDRIEGRLKPIEEDRARGKRQWEAAKKFIIPAIAAMAGFFGLKFGSAVYEAFLKLF